MRLIDTHTHAWGHDTDELPWQAEVLPPEWGGPYTHQDLVADMDRIDVDQSVVVTTPIYGRGARANEYTICAIEAYPDRLYGVALMHYFGEEVTVRERLRTVTGHPRILGVRMHAALEYEEVSDTMNRHADWILDDGLAPVWDEAAALDTTVFFFPKAQQLSTIEELAGAHPNVDMVVDHMAFPDETTDPNEPPWTDFEALAEYDNVAIKVSSLPRSAEEPWPYPDLHDYVRNLLEWFGAERLMLGSDYPWMDSWASYDNCLSWVEECEFVSARDLSYLSYRTLEAVHGG